jgi:hypothetical protein
MMILPKKILKYVKIRMQKIQMKHNHIKSLKNIQGTILIKDSHNNIRKKNFQTSPIPKEEIYTMTNNNMINHREVIIQTNILLKINQNNNLKSHKEVNTKNHIKLIKEANIPLVKIKRMRKARKLLRIKNNSKQLDIIILLSKTQAIMKRECLRNNHRLFKLNLV